MFSNITFCKPFMRLLSVCVFSLPLLVRAQPLDPAFQPMPEKKTSGMAPGPAIVLPLRARLDKDAIRAAVAATPADVNPYPRRHEVDTLTATPIETFTKDFAKARLPDCLHADGLRNQPTFFLTGFLALPFIGVAKLRGVCR